MHKVALKSRTRSRSDKSACLSGLYFALLIIYLHFQVCINVKGRASHTRILRKSNIDNRRRTPKQRHLLECTRSHLARSPKPVFSLKFPPRTGTKRLSASASMNDLQKTTIKGIPHTGRKQAEITQAGPCFQRSAIVLHLDLAENWTVALSN